MPDLQHATSRHRREESTPPLSPPPPGTSNANSPPYLIEGQSARLSLKIDDANDALVRKFVYGLRIDEPIGLVDVADANETYYYPFDGLGSVVALSDVNSVLAALRRIS
jgi:hypothetical protein